MLPGRDLEAVDRDRLRGLVSGLSGASAGIGSMRTHRKVNGRAHPQKVAPPGLLRNSPSRPRSNRNNSPALGVDLAGSTAAGRGAGKAVCSEVGRVEGKMADRVAGMRGREARAGIVGMAARRVRMDPWECEARVGMV